MADFFKYVDGARTKQQRWVDQGDGTWAPAVDVVAGGGSSGGAVTTKPGPRTPLGYVQVTNVAAAYTLAPPGGATIAVIEAEGNEFRYRTDNTAPTATVGQRLFDSQTIELAINPLTDVKLFPMDGVTTGTLNISYYS